MAPPFKGDFDQFEIIHKGRELLATKKKSLKQKFWNDSIQIFISNSTNIASSNR